MKMKLIALALCAAAPLAAQSWATPTGTAYAALVRDGGSNQWVASATLPATGEAGIAEASGALILGKLMTGTAASVASGTSSTDRTGVQSVATVVNVNILNGKITASRVLAISMLSQERNRSIAESDGSTIEGLTVNGVAMGSPAANTRVELPGVGYAILNEQITGKGRGVAFTVNMIHVYMSNGGEIIVGSATASTGS
jgi:hypothetical protein